MGLFFTAQNMIADLRERKDQSLETQRTAALNNFSNTERSTVSNFLETNRTPQLSSGPSSLTHAVQAMEEEKSNPSPSFFSMGDTNWGTDGRKQDFKDLLLDTGKQFGTKENPMDPDTLDAYFKNSQPTTYMDGQDVVYQGDSSGSEVQISQVLDGTVPSKDAARKIYLQNAIDEAARTSDESFIAYKLLEESTFSQEEGRYWSIEDFLGLNEDDSVEGTRILGELIYNIVDLGALGFSGANTDPGMTGVVGSMVIQAPKVQQMFLDISEGLLSIISSEEFKGLPVMEAIRTAVEGLTLDENPPGDESLNVSRLFEQIHWPWEPLGTAIDPDTVNKINESLPGALGLVMEGEESIYNNPSYTRSLTSPYQERVIPSPLNSSSSGPPILGSLGFIAASALGATDDPEELFNQLIEFLPIQRDGWEQVFGDIDASKYATTEKWHIAKLQQSRDIIKWATTFGKQIDWIDSKALEELPDELKASMLEYRKDIDEMFEQTLLWLSDKNHINTKSISIMLDEGTDEWRSKGFPTEITDYTQPKKEDGTRPIRKINNPKELLEYTKEQAIAVETEQLKYMDKGTIGEETKLMRLKLLNTYLEGQGKPSFNSWDDVMKTMHSFASDSEALASKENIALVQKVNEVNEAINNYYTAHTSPIQNLNGAVDGFFNPSTANSEYLAKFMNGDIYAPVQEKNRTADILSYGIEGELDRLYTEQVNKLRGDTDPHRMPFTSKADSAGGYNLDWDNLGPESRIAALRSLADFEEKYNVTLNALRPAIRMYSRGLDNLRLLFNPEEFNRDDQSRRDGINAAFLITDLGVLVENNDLRAKQKFFDRLEISDEQQILLLAFVGEAKRVGVLTYSLGAGLLEKPENLENLMGSAGQVMENMANIMTADALNLEDTPGSVKEAFAKIRKHDASLAKGLASKNYIKIADDWMILMGWQGLTKLSADELWEIHSGMTTALGIEIGANEEAQFRLKGSQDQQIDIYSIISLMINNKYIDPETVKTLTQLPTLGGEVGGTEGISPVTLATFYGSANLVRDNTRPAFYRKVDGSFTTAPKALVDNLTRVAVPPTFDLSKTLTGGATEERTIATAMKYNQPWLDVPYNDFITDYVGEDTVSGRNWPSRNLISTLPGLLGREAESYQEKRPERVQRFLESYVNADEIGILNETTGKRSLNNVATISGIDVRVSNEERSRGITPLTKLANEVERRARDTHAALQKIEVSREGKFIQPQTQGKGIYRREEGTVQEYASWWSNFQRGMGGGRGVASTTVGRKEAARWRSRNSGEGMGDLKDQRELVMTDILFTYLHLLEGEVVMQRRRVVPDSPTNTSVEWGGKDGTVHPAGSLVSRSGVTFGGNLQELPRINLPDTIYSEPTDMERPAIYIGTYNVERNPFTYVHDPSTRGSVAIQVRTSDGPQVFGVPHLNIPLNQIGPNHPLEVPSRIVGFAGWTMGMGHNTGMLFDHASNAETRAYKYQEYNVKRSNTHPAAISNDPNRQWNPPRVTTLKPLSDQDLFYKEMDEGSHREKDEDKNYRQYD